MLNNKPRQNRSIIWSIDKQELELTILRSSSYSESLRNLGIFSGGSSVNSLKRRILHEGIDTSHISKGKYANKGKRLGNYKHCIPNDELFIENSHRSRSVIRRRLLRDSLIPYKCSACGLDPRWNGKLLTLALDHINGIPNDDRLENLRFLCPNCHSQTDTFAGRNTDRVKSPKIKVPRKRKFEVSQEELKILLEHNSLVSVGKMFGVSDNAIRKRCKVLGVDF